MDIELTQSEIEGLSKAMKKPEFINLLNEYVDEISDPKNKAEQEAYLKQLEDQGELPPGRKLLRPWPHSCLKTFTTSKRKIKCFINICQSDEIMPPKLDRKNEGGNWQVPYAMGHPRHDQDNKHKNCLTFDCAFHPNAFQVAEGSSKFMKLLCDTAISAANQVMQSQGEKVSEDYKLMKNLKCKGGNPGSIMVSISRIENPSQPVKEREKTYKLSEEGPKLYKELLSGQIKNQREKEDEKIKAETRAAEREQAEELKEKEKEKGKIKELEINGVVQPKFKVMYSSDVDLGEFIENRYKVYKRPKEAVLWMSIPKVEKLEDCRLDVKQRNVVFEVKGVYFLEVKIDYDVVEDKASAKFDRKRKELRVVLPIVQAAEVLPQISPDVPLEVDEDENKEKIKEIREDAQESGSKKEENRENEEVLQQENNEVSKDDNENKELVQEITEKSLENQEPEKNDEKNMENLTDKQVDLDKPQETKPELPVSRGSKVSPCCMKLSSPLLFSLF